jgi:hypothetical protein
MKNYLMMYCVYHEGMYGGFKIKHLQADSVQEAEKLGHEYLESLVGKGKWEYIIAEHPTGYRIYNNVEHRRE